MRFHAATIGVEYSKPARINGDALRLLPDRLLELYVGKESISTNAYRPIIDALSIAHVLKTKGNMGDAAIIETSVREGSKISPGSDADSDVELWEAMARNAADLLLSNEQLAFGVLKAFLPDEPDDGERFKAVGNIILEKAKTSSGISSYVRSKRAV
jgi:hypothetical protein